MRLYREDRRPARARARRCRPPRTPPRRCCTRPADGAFAAPTSCARAWDGEEIVAFPHRPRVTGLARDPAWASWPGGSAQQRGLYRGLRPEALAAGALRRRAGAGDRRRRPPLMVTSAVRDEALPAPARPPQPRGDPRLLAAHDGLGVRRRAHVRLAAPGARVPVRARPPAGARRDRLGARAGGDPRHRLARRRAAAAAARAGRLLRARRSRLRRRSRGREPRRRPARSPPPGPRRPRARRGRSPAGRGRCRSGARSPPRATRQQGGDASSVGADGARDEDLGRGCAGRRRSPRRPPRASRAGTPRARSTPAVSSVSTCAGQDEGELDARAAQLEPDRLAEADDAVLRRAVGRDPGEADAAGDGGEVDDVTRAARAHPAHRLLRAVDDAVEVDLELAGDGGVRLLLEGADGHDPRVVDEHVERAEAALDLVEEGGEARAVGDVDGRASGAAAEPAARALGAAASTSPIATCAPSATSARASARPMPRPPPVTTATLPARARRLASSVRDRGARGLTEPAPTGPRPGAPGLAEACHRGHELVELGVGLRGGRRRRRLGHAVAHVAVEHAGGRPARARSGRRPPG